MSKLIDALKRAEELRLQKRLQTDDAKLSTSATGALNNNTANDTANDTINETANEIEAALVAEEARMASTRMLAQTGNETLTASSLAATTTPKSCHTQNI